MPRRLTFPLPFTGGGQGASLAVLSGLLLALAFPKPDQGWLAWLALVPLLRSDASFGRGYLSGFVFFALLLYWIYPTCIAGGVVPPVAFIATTALAAFLALQFGIFTAGMRRLRSLPLLAVPPAAAAFWVVLELVREHVLGFPWELLGYSQWRYPAMTQVAAITGVHGLSFLIVWVNAALALALSSPRGGGAPKGRWRAMLLGVPASAVALVLLVGAVQLRRQPDGAPLRVAILQGNIDQYKKWDAAYVKEIKDAYGALVTEQPGDDLVVWPESALPGWLDEPDVASWVSGLVKRSRTFHLIGTVTRDAEGAWNSAVMAMPDGRFGQRYSKRHLVPFGEYVPLQDLLGRWVPVLNELGGITAGVDPAPLHHPKARVGANVCYEVVFPNEVRQSVLSGASLIANVTNDGWYLKTAGPYQHLSMNALRAVENARPLVRAANTGVSAIFDAQGRLVASLPLGERGVLRGEVRSDSRTTPFTLYGEVFAWLCVAATAVFWFVSRS